jgi:hypothetical protein
MVRYKRKDFVSEKIGEETVIIDHQQGRLITLNETASVIWHLLSRPLTESSIVARLVRSYSDVNKKEVSQSLKELKNQGLVEAPPK